MAVVAVVVVLVVTGVVVVVVVLVLVLVLLLLLLVSLAGVGQCPHRCDIVLPLLLQSIRLRASIATAASTCI